MQEARQFKRAEVSFTVVYKVNSPLAVRMRIGGKEFEAVALDLSEGGMAVLTEHINYAIPAFTTVTVKFSIVNDTALTGEERERFLEIHGEVRSSFFLREKKAYRMGIRFIGLSGRERSFLAAFVKMSLLKKC